MSIIYNEKYDFEFTGEELKFMKKLIEEKLIQYEENFTIHRIDIAVCEDIINKIEKL